MSFRNPLRGAPAVTLFAIVLAGCRGRAEPVASLSVEPKDVSLPAGSAAGLKLNWNPKAPLDNLQGKPRVFVHLLASGRNLVRTFDHPLAEEWTPWRAQSYEIELYQSALAEPLPVGAYELTAGLYDDSSGERWPLEAGGDEVGRREYRLATVVVPPGGAAVPTFDFAGGWLPAEPGGSRQVITRRCARGEATIAVRQAASSGTVVLGSSVPKLASGGWGGAVEVTASCAAERGQVNGPELQWTRIPIASSSAEPACEIRFRPVPPADANARSLCLEVLAWRPAGG